jgi:tetratricopeptide (TPR) repeat protein
MNPDYWIAHRILGVFYYNQQRLDNAALAWQAAARYAPRDVVTLNNLGAVYYYRGMWSDAHDTFLRSFKIRPDCLSCNNVASTLFLDRKYREAASYFETALSPEYCDSTDHLVWGNLASALYWADGTRPRALAVYTRAIALAEKDLAAKPDAPDMIAKLVDYYAMSGDSVRAFTMIERASPYLEKDREVMYRVGSAYEKLGRRRSAIHHLANAVRHGYALPLILADPVLQDLITDPVFKEMTSNEAVADGAGATKGSQ